MDLKGRNFLTLKDFSPEEINALLELSKELKEKKRNGITHRMHEGKNIALIVLHGRKTDGTQSRTHRRRQAHIPFQAYLRQKLCRKLNI